MREETKITAHRFWQAAGEPLGEADTFWSLAELALHSGRSEALGRAITTLLRAGLDGTSCRDIVGLLLRSGLTDVQLDVVTKWLQRQESPADLTPSDVQKYVSRMSQHLYDTHAEALRKAGSTPEAIERILLPIALGLVSNGAFHLLLKLAGLLQQGQGMGGTGRPTSAENIDEEAADLIFDTFEAERLRDDQHIIDGSPTLQVLDNASRTRGLRFNPSLHVLNQLAIDLGLA